MKTRLCESCDQELPLEDFDSKTKGGVLWRDSLCKKCRQVRKQMKELIIADARRTHKKIIIPDYLKES